MNAKFSRKTLISVDLVQAILRNGKTKTWKNPRAAWRWLKNHRNLNACATLHAFDEQFDQWFNWDVC